MNKRDPKFKKANNILKYSGMAFELLAIMLISVFVGGWLDDYFGFEKPIIMLVMMIFLFAGYVFKLSKDVNK